MTSENGKGGELSRVRLVFADEGTFHSVFIDVPSVSISSYERLIDLLREDPSVTSGLYVDMKRLVTASLVDDSEGG